MKKLIILLLAVMMNGVGRGQSYSIKTGAIMDDDEFEKKFTGTPPKYMLWNFENSFDSYFNTSTSKGFRSFRGAAFMKDKYFQIGIFDNYINFVGTKKITTELSAASKQEYIHEALVRTAGKDFALYTIVNKEETEFKVYLNQLSESTVLMGTPLLIHTFTQKKKAPNPNINARQSPNKKYFLLYRTVKTDKDEDSQIDCKVLDENWGEVWTNRVVLPNKGDVIYQIELDNAGNLVFSSNKEDNGIIVTGSYEAGYSISCYNWNNKSVVAYNYPNNPRLYTDFKIFMIDGQTILVTLVKPKKKGDALELSLAVLEPKTRNLSLKTINLPAEVSAALNNDNNDNRFVEAVNLIRLQNDGYILTLESNSTTLKGVNANYTFYESGTIGIFSLSRDFSLQWSKFAHKSSSIKDSGAYGSHALCALSNNRALIIYNDNQKNAENPPTESKVKTFNILNGYIATLEIGEDGKITKSSMLDAPEWDKFTCNLSSTRKIENGLYQILLARYYIPKGYKIAYGTLTLN